MSVTSRGTGWEIAHSLWIAWTLTLGFFNWVGYFYIGIRTRQVKWLLWGVFYAVPFIFSMALFDTPAFDGWLGSTLITLLFLSGGVSIVHAFMLRKEYLMRLDALQRRSPVAAASMRRRIDTEYSRVEGAGTANRETESRETESRETEAPRPSGDKAPEREPAAESPSSPGVDLNDASEEELAALPGVGIAAAKRAVMLRGARGGFGSVEDFGESLALKPHVVERLRPLVFVSSFRGEQRPGSSGRVIDY